MGERKNIGNDREDEDDEKRRNELQGEYGGLFIILKRSAHMVRVSKIIREKAKFSRYVSAPQVTHDSENKYRFPHHDPRLPSIPGE